jgi:hypothetical protein
VAAFAGDRDDARFTPGSTATTERRSTSTSRSAGWRRSSTADLECDADTDRETRRMARSLDRQGEGGVYEFEDDDGDQVVARRVKGALKIESRDNDGETAKVEMPWPLAECLFLGREPHGGLSRALGDGDFKVRVESSDGDRVSIDVD